MHYAVIGCGQKPLTRQWKVSVFAQYSTIAVDDHRNFSIHELNLAEHGWEGGV